jgi:HTH-type transcriptional regulator / antitoxin HigA
MFTIDRPTYTDLLTLYQPKIIDSEETYNKTLEALGQLMDKGENATPEEISMMNLLAILIEIYEDEKISKMDLEEVTPQEVLNHLMEAQDLKQSDLLPVFGSKGIISEVVNGKRQISKNQAKKLGEFFSVSPVLFI